MRTIKFKAKAANGEWVIGCLLYRQDGSVYIYDDNNDVSFSGLVCSEEETALRIPVDRKTACQFTGFLDKNGKEIYEGDVLRSDSYPYSCFEDEERDNYFAVVFYCEDGASFATVTVKNPESNVGGIADGICNDVWREEMKRFEVVGNIHEEKWQEYGEYFKTEEGKEADND